MAESQQGCFSAEQAAEAGFSNQLLNKHLHSGNIERIRRGIYRLSRFPEVQRGQEDLIVAWLWSARTGVLSHETALQLHELSDALPASIHLTVPASWQKRRIHPPEGVRLYFADLAPSERGWIGSVPVTTPARSIVDVALAHGDATVIETAIRQALRRNLASLAELSPAVAFLSGSSARAAEGTAELEGTWITDVLCGTCTEHPQPDWRVRALDLARRHGARLRVAMYSPASRIQQLELAWPVSELATKPTWQSLHDEAAEVFGWQ